MGAKRIWPGYFNSYFCMKLSFKMPAAWLLAAAGCDPAATQKQNLPTVSLTPVLPADLFPIKSAYSPVEILKLFGVVTVEQDLVDAST
jgi:hypothetical protein